MASLTSRVARCEHGRMLRHDPEPTAAIAATSGRPCGLHTTASHTGGMVAPSDPGVRAAQIRDFIFGRMDPSQTVIQVQAVKAGITTLTGVLIGKIPHFPPARRNPPPYKRKKTKGSHFFTPGTETMKTPRPGGGGEITRAAACVPRLLRSARHERLRQLDWIHKRRLRPKRKRKKA